ncbi:MAG: molybdopterin dinucleotide binding domain-containing protein [Caldimonas sp.]
MVAAVQGMGRARLYTDGHFATADGRARFVAVPYRAAAEPCDARHPFALNTGRLRDQWHGMSRTGTVARLFGHEGSPVVRMSPDDVARRGLKAGELVEVRSRRGAIVLPLVGDDRIGRAHAYIAMHWGDEFLSGISTEGERRAGVNALTSKAYCPDSFQPELKHAAVAIKPADLPWRLTAAAWLPDNAVVEVRERLRTAMPSFAYAACVPVLGHDGRTGVSLQAASARPIDKNEIDAIAGWLGLTGPSTLRYADPVRGTKRLLALEGEGAAARLGALLLVGEAPAADWLRGLWQEQLEVAPYGRFLLAPQANSPQGLAPRSPQVCNCLDVSEQRIRDCLARLDGEPAVRIAGLQAALKCGTQCGSCQPDLRRLEHAVPAPREAVAS